MGQCEAPSSGTCGEAQARYVVAREDPLPILSGMIPGGQDKLEQKLLGRGGKIAHY